MVVPWTADPDATPTRHGHYALPPGNADGFAQPLGTPHFWRDPWRSVSGVRKEELGRSPHCQEPFTLSVEKRRDWRAFRAASWSLFYGQSEGPCVRAFVRGQLVVPWTADPDATPTRHGHYALPPGNADGFAQPLGTPHFWRDPWRSVSGVRKEELGRSAHCQEPRALPPDSLWDKNQASEAMVKWHNPTKGS